jgi:hypothetical protein
MAGRRKLKSDFFGRGRGRGGRRGFEGGFRNVRGMRRSSSFGRKSRKGTSRNEGRFEVVDRNGILSGTNLKEEGMRGSGEDLIGARVGRRKGWFVGWGANEDVGGRKVGGWNIRRNGGRRRIG